MLKTAKFIFNSFSENTYVLWDDETMETAVIDPGCFEAEEEKRLQEFIDGRNLVPKYLINTHGHLDHILGCGFVKNNYEVIYYAPEPDIPLLNNAGLQASAFGIEIPEIPSPEKYITEDTEINLGGILLKFLFTPGHTPGEYCIYLPDEKICITGDVLFKESIGRTDLWGGDYNLLLESIKTKLLKLDDEVEIFPGHGEASTIGDEKKFNPFIHEIQN
jgi:glyoxylase-like metal-dependent hydrolase (beta-lactamase superfamily II)